jgi:hypothetical protein
MTGRWRILAQLPLTLAVLAWAPGNFLKLGLLLALWAATFGRLSPRELVLFIGGSLLFAVLDMGAIRQGLFRFAAPDFLGLPAYEFVLWGFYLLHALRLLGGPPPAGHWAGVLPLAAVFALPFLTLTDPRWLTVAAAGLLVLLLVRFHAPWDWAYVGYLALMGLLVEATGVAAGLWTYPGDPGLGIPVWFVAMWGGIGLFLRRLVLPLVRPPGPGDTHAPARKTGGARH